MKKTLIIFIAIMMLFSFFLASCSKGQVTSTPTSSSPAASQTTSPTTSKTTSPSTSQTTSPTTSITTSPATTTAVEQPQRGGVLKIVTGNAVLNLGCPYEAVNGGDLYTSAPCVETLVRVDPAGNATPWLAKSWQLSSDKKSMTMTLQQGVTFHDGAPFNAEAVKTNMDMYRNGNLPDLKNVTSVDVVDSYTVRINFSEYHSDFLDTLAWSTGRMISPTALNTYSDKDLYSRPVGTGPFKFVSYTPEVSLIYTKYDKYWQTGKPYLDGVQFDFVGDRTVGLMAFKSGQDQIDAFLDPLSAPELQANPKYTVYTLPAVTVGAVESSANPGSPFADIRVRQAINYAIPRDQLPPLVGYGAQPGAQLLPKGNGGYNPDIPAFTFDPAKAKALLADAGYPNGFDTNIYVYSYIEMDAWTAIQGYLKDVGIRTTINSLQMSAWMDLVFNKGWEGISCLYVMCFPGQSPINDIVGSLSNGGTQSPTSKSMLYPFVYNETVANTLVETDPAKTQANVQVLNRMAIIDNCMFQPFYVYYMVSVRSNTVHDALLYEKTLHLWTPEDAWISK